MNLYLKWDRTCEITQDLVKFLFDYRDGELYWKIYPNNNRKVKIGDKVGSPNSNNRFSVQIKCKNFLIHRIIFLWHHGYMPKFIDHEDQNIHNNRIENLRPATKSENNSNRKSSKNSSSQYLGVHLFQKKYWVASISRKVSGKKNGYIGLFHTENEAVLAYNREAVRYHKEFANLNIIKP